MRLKTYKGAGIALFKKTSEGYSILLGKRTINPGKGKWYIFGGKSKTFDKTPFETAKRDNFLCRIFAPSKVKDTAESFP